ncbi:Frigida-like [Macleaya cordata]|uniref:FRIGIDA-like protein n=1 Tax=Macleaya cordata TaxID=56857 RepID=A0A200QZZ8_MACCD|nr:Frigida-like [Macleaya cordata]
MESISAALKSTELKKQNLHKAFENLQSHSSCLSSFNLQWKDMEDHFNSIQKSLEQRFKELEEKERESNKEVLVIKQTSLEKKSEVKPNESESMTLKDLKSLCVKMDGIRFVSYIMDHRKDHPTVRDEVPIAFKSAIDPAKLVLDAMQVFYPQNQNEIRGGELGASRRTCNMLLEILMASSPQINPGVKEEAKKLAFKWKSKVKVGGETSLETFGFLQLLATYGLASEFKVDELLELLVFVVRRKQAVDWFLFLGLVDKVPDFIRKLSSKKKQLDAVRFVYEFKLVDKFPPVPLLKAYLNESREAAEEFRQKGNNSLQAQNDAIVKEIGALKAVIRFIEEHQLESQYPRESLEKRIEQLEKEKKERKRPAEVPVPAPTCRSEQQHQQNGKKRSRSALNTNAVTTSAASSSQNYLQPLGFSSDQVALYLRSSTHYGLAGAVPAIPQYMNSVVQPTGFRGTQAQLCIGENLSPSRSHLYSFESQTASAPRDRSILGAYGLHPSYYPSFYS